MVICLYIGSIDSGCLTPFSGVTATIYRCTILFLTYAHINTLFNSIAWNNITYHNSGWGIQLWHAANAGTLGNNVVFENQTGGITIGDGAPPGGVIADGIVVTNNIIVHNYGTRAGLYEYTANGNIGTNQYIDNLLYVNAPVNKSLKNTDVGTIIADPQFSNYQPDGSGDYHLQSSSPAIDTGTSTGAPSTDFDGNARPQGAGFDIGAYEYGKGLTATKTPAPIATLVPTTIISTIPSQGIADTITPQPTPAPYYYPDISPWVFIIPGILIRVSGHCFLCISRRG